MRGTVSLERTIEAVLGGGLLASAALLLAGLLLDRPGLLKAGVLLLIVTPVVRVVVVTAGMIARKDWVFALISAAVLGVLGASAWLALSVERPRASRPAALFSPPPP